jgi:hypothetical protein
MSICININVYKYVQEHFARIVYIYIYIYSYNTIVSSSSVTTSLALSHDIHPDKITAYNTDMHIRIVVL